MLKQYEELAVLEEGDDGAIVSIRGQGGPSVLLSAAYIGHLEKAVRKARAELADISPVRTTALHLLCEEVYALVTQHQATCNKYEGGPGAAQSLAVAIEELEEIRQQLSTFPSSGP